MTGLGLHVERGGTGADLVVLLHGLGATGAVWHRLARAIEARGRRWIAPDLRGHGRSPSAGPFGFGLHAADVATLLRDEDPARVTLLGHSFGGVVGALLAGGLFGPLPARLETLGVKLTWSEADLAGARAAAQRPARLFATRDDAQERYARIAGLHGLVAPEAPEMAGGVTAVEGGYALAMNPGVFSAADASVPDLLRRVRVPLRMAAGAEDPMVTLAEMTAIDPAARLLPGQPHNAQITAPEAVLALLDP